MLDDGLRAQLMQQLALLKGRLGNDEGRDSSGATAQNEYSIQSLQKQLDDDQRDRDLEEHMKAMSVNRQSSGGGGGAGSSGSVIGAWNPPTKPVDPMEGYHVEDPEKAVREAAFNSIQKYLSEQNPHLFSTIKGQNGRLR